MTRYEVIIIGGGPAGLTAGLYTSRAGLKTVLLERSMFGGQIVNAQIVENYPGFPEGISGFELASLMHQQATKYGLEIINAEATGIRSGQPHNVLTSDSTFEADTIIIASGAEYNKLGINGEKKWFFLEADRHTEPQRRSTFKKSSVYSKVLGYLEFWRQRRFKDEESPLEPFKMTNFRALFVTLSDKRAENLQLLAREADPKKKGLNLFMVTSQKNYDIKNAQVLFDDIWRIPSTLDGRFCLG